MPLYSRTVVPLAGVWKIEERPEELLQMFSHAEWFLPEAGSFSSERRKAEWLSVRALLRALLGEECQIGYHPGGKPYLPESEWNISISHTEEYAAVMLSKNEYVGIDIEHVSHSSRATKLQERFLSPEDLAMGGNMGERFPLLAWSAKETAFKMLGLEGVDFRGQLQILPFSLGEKGVMEILETRSPRHGICRIHYAITGDFILTFSDSYTAAKP